MSNTPATNLTVKLLRIIGSPFEPRGGASADGDESLELHNYAAENKLLLLYLETLRQQGRLDKLREEYEAEQAKYERFLQGLVKVSELLRTWDIRHVIVKTLRPYLAVPSDVDVLVLGRRAMYKTAVEVLLRGKYTPFLSQLVDMEGLADEKAYAQAVETLTYPTWDNAHISPSGSTFVDEYGIHIDLQNDMAVSYVTYLDKDKLEEYLSTMTLPGRHSISALLPEFELVSVIAHSVMERSYRLGEFYTFLHHLSKMDERQVRVFIILSKESKLELALKAFVSLTAQLHKAAFNTIPPKVDFILAKTGFNYYEASSLEATNFQAPHRYCLPTMAGVFFNKMEEKKFRKGVGTQLIKMLNPKVASLAVRGLASMGK